MGKINHAIALLLRWLLTAMVLAMTLVILAQVVWRYLLEAPFIWSEEMALTLMAWMTFLGSALLLMRQEHLGIDVFVARLPDHWARAARLIGRACILVFCLVLTWGAWLMIQRTQHSVTPGLRISVAWQYAGGFVGGILLTLVAAEQFVATLIGRDRDTDSLGEVAE